MLFRNDWKIYQLSFLNYPYFRNRTKDMMLNLISLSKVVVNDNISPIPSIQHILVMSCRNITSYITLSPFRAIVANVATIYESPVLKWNIVLSKCVWYGRSSFLMIIWNFRESAGSHSKHNSINCFLFEAILKISHHDLLVILNTA